MRILHLISSLHRGGAETILVALIKGLCALGHQQEVIYIHDGPLRDEITHADIACYQLSAYGTYANPLLWIRLVQRVQQYKPDIIHTSLWASNLMGRVVGPLLGIPTIGSVHALPEHEGIIRNTIERCVPHHPKTIAASATIAHALVASGLYNEAELIIIPNGICREKLHQEAVNQTIIHQKPIGAFVIGAVGRLVPVKQFDRLIAVYAAFQKQYPDTQLWIIGSGPEEQRLRALITQHQLTAQAHIITGHKATAFYPQFDCFILPSRHEGLGIVILEAMAFGLPVIATYNRHHPHGHEIIIDKHNGLLVDPDNSHEWLYALQRYKEDADLRQTYAQAGLKTVDTHFTHTEMIVQYEQAFFKTIEHAA